MNETKCSERATATNLEAEPRGDNLLRKICKGRYARAYGPYLSPKRKYDPIEVRMVRVRENGKDHRVSDDGDGIRCDVKVKKGVGERLVPLRALRANRQRLIAVGWRLIAVIGGATIGASGIG